MAALTGEGFARVLLPDDTGVDRLIRGARGEGQVILPVHILFVHRVIRQVTLKKRHNTNTINCQREGNKPRAFQPFAADNGHRIHKLVMTFTSWS